MQAVAAAVEAVQNTMSGVGFDLPAAVVVVVPASSAPASAQRSMHPGPLPQPWRGFEGRLQCTGSAAGAWRHGRRPGGRVGGQAPTPALAGTAQRSSTAAANKECAPAAAAAPCLQGAPGQAVPGFMHKPMEEVGAGWCPLIAALQRPSRGLWPWRRNPGGLAALPRLHLAACSASLPMPHLPAGLAARKGNMGGLTSAPLPSPASARPPTCPPACRCLPTTSGCAPAASTPTPHQRPLCARRVL